MNTTFLATGSEGEPITFDDDSLKERNAKLLILKFIRNFHPDKQSGKEKKV